MWFEWFPPRSPATASSRHRRVYVLYDIVRSHGRAWRRAYWWRWAAYSWALLLPPCSFVPFAAATEQPRHLLSRSEHERAPAVRRGFASSVMPFAPGSSGGGQLGYGPKNPRRDAVVPRRRGARAGARGDRGARAHRAATAVRGHLDRRSARYAWRFVYGGGRPLALAVHLPVFSNNFVGWLRLRCCWPPQSWPRSALSVCSKARGQGPKRTRDSDGAAVGPEQPLRSSTGAVILWALGYAARRTPGAVVAMVVLRASRRCAGAGDRGDRDSRRARAPRVVGAARAAPRTRGAVHRCGIEALGCSCSPGGRELQKPADYYPATPTTQFLATHLDGNRYAADNDTLFPSANTVYKLRAVSGHRASRSPRGAISWRRSTRPSPRAAPCSRSATRTRRRHHRYSTGWRRATSWPSPACRCTAHARHRLPRAARSQLTDGEATTFSDQGPLARIVGARAPQGFLRAEARRPISTRRCADAPGKILAQARRLLLDLPPIDIDVAVPGDAPDPAAPQ